MVMKKGAIFVGLFLLSFVLVGSFGVSAEEIICTDSDNGDNPSVQGISVDSSKSGSYLDFCAEDTISLGYSLEGKYLVEYYCRISEQFKVYYKNGTVRIFNGTYLDESETEEPGLFKLEDGTIIRTFAINEEFGSDVKSAEGLTKGLGQKLYSCLEGCFEGKCLNAEEIEPIVETFTCKEKSDGAVWISSEGRETSGGPRGLLSCVTLIDSVGKNDEELDDFGSFKVGDNWYFLEEECGGENCFLSVPYCKNLDNMDHKIKKCSNCSDGTCNDVGFTKIINWFKNLLS
ncbi:MAG: hypothetical protein AABX93_03725 [Nanoarchaeota archaeon]